MVAGGDNVGVEGGGGETRTGAERRAAERRTGAEGRAAERRTGARKGAGGRTTGATGRPTGATGAAGAAGSAALACSLLAFGTGHAVLDCSCRFLLDHYGNASQQVSFKKSVWGLRVNYVAKWHTAPRTAVRLFARVRAHVGLHMHLLPGPVAAKVALEGLDLGVRPHVTGEVTLRPKDLRRRQVSFEVR